MQKKIILYSQEKYTVYRREDDTFLEECLSCNRKMCIGCHAEKYCRPRFYCKEYKDPEKDLVECSNCGRECFDSCSIDLVTKEKTTFKGIECCVHCALDLSRRLQENIDHSKTIKKAVSK